MASKPATIDEYIEAAPPEGRAHLEHLFAILKGVAPEAERVIKWNQPFFVEPRFLFAFSANKAHLNFSPGQDALEAFRDELGNHRTTKNFLQVRYDEPLPEDLIRRIAEYRLKALSEREDDSFW